MVWTMARRLNIKPNTIITRLNRGWETHRALGSANANKKIQLSSSQLLWADSA